MRAKAEEMTTIPTKLRRVAAAPATCGPTGGGDPQPVPPARAAIAVPAVCARPVAPALVAMAVPAAMAVVAVVAVASARPLAPAAAVGPETARRAP